MTTVSMDHTPAEKFTLTSFSWGGSHIYCALASARPKISDELWRDSVAGLPYSDSPGRVTPVSIVPFNAPTTDRFTLRESLEWYDPDIDCTLVVSAPHADRVLWSDYANGALRNYRKHGVECALDTEALRTGADTVMFFAVVDHAGRTVAGLRAIGPLRSAEDSHAVVEWAGQPSQRVVRNTINDRVPFGVLEMKSAWATDDPDRSHRITEAMARSAFHMMALLNNQFCMATAAAYALNRWRSSGGVVSPIPATPYPSERYQTKMMWWDRHDFVNHAKPEQVSKILTETQLLTRRFGSQSASGLRASTAT